MLILGRKENESIHIGSNVTVTIEDISRGMVKIGIDAPKDVVILRGELKDKIAKENLKATAKVDKQDLKDFSKLLKKW